MLKAFCRENNSPQCVLSVKFTRQSFWHNYVLLLTINRIFAYSRPCYHSSLTRIDKMLMFSVKKNIFSLDNEKSMLPCSKIKTSFTKRHSLSKKSEKNILSGVVEIVV